MPTNARPVSQSFWTRLAAWLEALEPPSAADDADRLRNRIAVLERELTALKTSRGANTQEQSLF